MIGLAPWLQFLLITLKYIAIPDLQNFQFTVTHALGLSIFTSRLLATDLHTEINTSNHYEVFLLFRLQSLWNLGTKNCSELTPPAYDWLITALEIIMSESELCYDWRYTANQFVLAPSPLRFMTRIFFSQLKTRGLSPYITSSLTWVWVCNLQLLVAFASAFILGSESR
jgi:hypothetical protein